MNSNHERLADSKRSMTSAIVNKYCPEFIEWYMEIRYRQETYAAVILVQRYVRAETGEKVSDKRSTSSTAVFNVLQPSMIGFGDHSEHLQRDIITLGLVEAMMALLGTYLTPTAERVPNEEPCDILVLWNWENGVRPREPGGSLQRVPSINNFGRPFYVADPVGPFQISR